MGALSSTPEEPGPLQRKSAPDAADDPWSVLRYRPMWIKRLDDASRLPPPAPRRPSAAESAGEPKTPSKAGMAPAADKENCPAQPTAAAAVRERGPALSPLKMAEEAEAQDDFAAGGAFSDFSDAEFDDDHSGDNGYDDDDDDDFDMGGGGFGGFGAEGEDGDGADDDAWGDASAALDMFDDLESECLASYKPKVQPYPATRCGLVFAVGEMQGRRDAMEDSFAAVTDVLAEEAGAPLTWLGVFDGHGGTACAEATSQSLLAQITATPAFAQVSAGGGGASVPTLELLQTATRNGFLEFDAALQAQRGAELRTCGATAITAFATPSHLLVACCGDSRALLGRGGGKAVPLSRDHTPAVPSEAERIVAAGAKVSFGRVNGALAVSRAFGDFVYKQADGLAAKLQAVTCAPEVCTVPRAPGADEFLLLACDGIFEVLDNDALVEAVRERLLARKARGEPAADAAAGVAGEVLEVCFEGGSEDNMTLAVAVFEEWYSS